MSITRSDSPTGKVHHATDGFTLIEVIMALALTSLATLSMIALYRSHLQAYQLGTAQVEAQRGLRTAMTRISHDLRSAGYDPSGTSGAGVVAAHRDFLYFTRDIVSSAPPALDGADEHLAFCLYQGDKLGIHRGSQGGGSCSGSGGPACDRPGRGYHQPLAEGITHLEFVYWAHDRNEAEQRLAFDGPQGGVSDPDTIRRVEIVLESEFHHQGKLRTERLRDSVFLRNMGL